MFSGWSSYIKKLLPKRLFYRALLIVAAPILILQVIISIVFFDSLWIKTNKGMTRALINEISTFVEVFDNEKRATELLDKANELLLQDAFNADFSDPTMEDSLVNLSGITNDILSSLSANKIKKLDELAEMSVGELMDLSDKITETEASALIMEARKPWFE